MSLNYLCEFCCLEQSNNPILPDYLMDVDTDGIHQGLVFTGDNYLIKPDISPIVENHFLIIPKEHVFCMNSSTLNNSKDELEMVKKKIVDYYHSFDMESLFFEHGCCSDKESGSSCIHHAHLHAIPVTFDQEKKIICEVVKELGAPVFVSKDIESMEYLYLETEKVGSMYWVDKTKQSQFFRILISKTIGNIKRSRWQNCLIDERQRKQSKQWLEKFELFSL